MNGEADQLQEIAQRALDYVKAGNVVGLGSGRAATAFIRALGERVRQGLQVRGVATSLASEKLARELGIPLTTLDEVDTIDVDIDGADEVDPQLNVIKGYGGALLREKIVAQASQRLIILVGEEKLVPVLGARGKLPVETVAFGLAATKRQIAALGCNPQQRLLADRPFVSDNGNPVLDCGVSPMTDPADLEQRLLKIAGVCETGLFLGMVHAVLVQRDRGVAVLERRA